jgi:D-3-phosphoglycerate dehydrogenase
MTRVLIADKMSPRAEEVFQSRGIEAEVRTGLSASDLAASMGAYDGLVVRSATKVTAEVLSGAGLLKVIGRAGIGVDNIDVAAATARGIAVMNAPFGNAVTTAEHTVAMMFALARRIPAADRSTRSGEWDRVRFMGVELAGKTLGVIGCGNIGSIVAERALGLKMKVLVHDPYLSVERTGELGIEKVDLDDLLARSDFITLHVPLNEATRAMIDAAAITKTKPEVRVINCARGGLVDEEALKAALESGHVAGAALDVFAHEPATGNPLFALDNVIVTPHLGASTLEAQEKVAVQIAEQMADYLLDGVAVNSVNMPAIGPEEAARLAPYMKLAEQLGSFAGQLAEAGLLAALVEYEGQVAELNTRPLTDLVLAGMLSPHLESVNMINAPVIARERDIEVTEAKHDRAHDYQTRIRVTVKTETGEHTVAGTLFGGDKPRIVEAEGMAVEAELGPYVLFTRNHDRPGFIGWLGTALGEAGINIATFHLGRMDMGGDALALVTVDQPLSDELLEKVRALPLVIEAKALSF